MLIFVVIVEMVRVDINVWPYLLVVESCTVTRGVECMKRKDVS